MLESVQGVETHVLDHHGLVAAKCQDLRLAQRIDARLASGEKRIVSFGKACVAMVLNGLGFTNRSLYLTPQFFASKPVDVLLGDGIQAQHLNDDALGDALDAIANYGPSKLFAEVAFEIVMEHDLLDGLAHVDTTTFSVHGDYANQGTPLAETTSPVAPSSTATLPQGLEPVAPKAEPALIEVTHGYSKDHRPDLKQVVLSLAVTGGSGVPLWMTPCDGNASDKVVLAQTIERVEAFRREIDCTHALRWVADSALYTADNLVKMKDLVWVSRVPESIQKAKSLVCTPAQDIAWKEQEDGYRIAAFEAAYAGIAQRWLLVFSEQAYKREKKTLDKRLATQEEALHKSLRQSGNEVFACEADAQKAFHKRQKAHPLFNLTAQITRVEKYAQAGRPKAGQEKACIGYQVQVGVARNAAAIAQLLETKGRFILATNDLDESNYPDARILADYKAQQTVEYGFRFLKNPEFLADTLFLKSPKRIAALMMIMTLCLMVYNISQHQMRQQLKDAGETLPNQLGKSTDRPTLRWIFQIMEGIASVRIFDHDRTLVHEVVSNLNDLRLKIIRLFGKTACLIYRVAGASGGM
jgi:transposase